MRSRIESKQIKTMTVDPSARKRPGLGRHCIDDCQIPPRNLPVAVRGRKPETCKVQYMAKFRLAVNRCNSQSSSGQRTSRIVRPSLIRTVEGSRCRPNTTARAMCHRMSDANDVICCPVKTSPLTSQITCDNHGVFSKSLS